MSVASMAGYLNKTGSVGYRMASGSASIHQSQDERFRWSAHLDNLPNIYVQPDSSRTYSEYCVTIALIHRINAILYCKTYIQRRDVSTFFSEGLDN